MLEENGIKSLNFSDMLSKRGVYTWKRGRDHAFNSTIDPEAVTNIYFSLLLSFFQFFSQWGDSSFCYQEIFWLQIIENPANSGLNK